MQQKIAHFNELYSPIVVREILTNYHLSLKKRYGQNFLINKAVAQRIAAYLLSSKNDTVFEIGPGLGTLTFLIYSQVHHLLINEVDRGLVRFLSHMITHHAITNIDIITGDFLSLPIEKFSTNPPITKVLSNFPYSIAIKALIKILDYMPDVQRIVGTVQKEIAERLTAQPGNKNYGAVSVYTQFIAQILIKEKELSPYNFYPSPDVSSAIIIVNPLHKQLSNERRLFFKKVVHACFSHRRKRVINNLVSNFRDIPKEELVSMSSAILKNPEIRAEQLTVDAYAALTNALLPLIGTVS